LTFGLVTTAGNSLIVDIMPASRRGEGLGYFGVANNLAMAIGPMISLFLHDYYNYDVIFYTAIVAGLFGFVFAYNIKSDKKADRSVKQPLAFDRFFLLKGFKSGFCLLLLGIPYGILTTYVAIYGKELGVQSGMGVFFSLMAVGCGAYLTGLRRTRTAGFLLEDAITLDAYIAMSLEEREACLLPADSLLAEVPALMLDAEQFGRIRHGMNCRMAGEGEFRLYAPGENPDNGRFIGLGEVVDGSLRPKRLLSGL
jgi:hypothetical protein